MNPAVSIENANTLWTLQTQPALVIATRQQYDKSVAIRRRDEIFSIRTYAAPDHRNPPGSLLQNFQERGNVTGV